MPALSADADGLRPAFTRPERSLRGVAGAMRVWDSLAAVVLGSSLWMAHFIYVLAIRGVPEPWVILLSAMIAIAMAATGYRIALGRRHSRVWAGLAGAVLGVGLVALHAGGATAAAIPLDPQIAPSAAIAGLTLVLLVLAVVLVTVDRGPSNAPGREAASLSEAHAELRATQRELVTRLCAAAEHRDYETGAHMTRMAHVAHRLALVAGYDAAFAEQVLAAAPLHDIGKIGVADEILFKVGALSAEERTAMQAHAALGGRILGGSALPLLKLAAEIAQSHHEKWDGAGYPYGLRQTEIPLSGRIVAVADVFDALLSERPYKRGWSLEHVADHMAEEAGKHFDPHLIQAMLSDLAGLFAIWCEHRDPAPPAWAGCWSAAVR